MGAIPAACLIARPGSLGDRVLNYTTRLSGRGGGPWERGDGPTQGLGGVRKQNATPGGRGATEDSRTSLAVVHVGMG